MAARLAGAAVKTVDKAIEAARDAGNDEMLRSLESARATLGEQLIRMGVRVPEPGRGKGRTGAAA